MSIHLVCIKTGIIPCKDPRTKQIINMQGWHLVKGKKYTADEMKICDHGQLCYAINQFSGYNLRLVERFREVDEDYDAELADDMVAVPIGDQEDSFDGENDSLQG